MLPSILWSATRTRGADTLHNHLRRRMKARVVHDLHIITIEIYDCAYAHAEYIRVRCRVISDDRIVIQQNSQLVFITFKFFSYIHTMRQSKLMRVFFSSYCNFAAQRPASRLSRQYWQVSFASFFYNNYFQSKQLTTIPNRTSFIPRVRKHISMYFCFIAMIII